MLKASLGNRGGGHKTLWKQMEADIKPITQVNASIKPSVHRAVSCFKAKGMLSNFLNLFSTEGRRKISSDSFKGMQRVNRSTLHYGISKAGSSSLE